MPEIPSAQYFKARNALMDIASVFATDEEHTALAEAVQEMESDGASNDDILKGLLDMLQDGIKYGNWPGGPKTISEIIGPDV